MKSRRSERVSPFRTLGFLAAVRLFSALTLPGQRKRPPSNNQLAREINEIFAADLENATSSDALHVRVRQIFATYGVPTNEMVGNEAAEEYVVLLSGQPLSFLNMVLPNLKRAANAGEISENSFIYLDVQARQRRIRDGLPPPTDPVLQKQIERLVAADQAVRPTTGRAWGLKRLQATDRADGVTARAVFSKYGLPTFALVGPRAAEGFDDVVQHQPLEFQKAVLPQMEADAKAGQVGSESYAMLLDRVESNSGRPQTYGENFICTPDGKMKPAAISDAKNVDARRAKLGLMPLGLYSKVLGTLYMNSFCAQVASTNRKSNVKKPAGVHAQQ